MLPDIAGVEFSEYVADDLYEIWLYIARDSVYYADKTIDELVARIRMLGNHPGIGSERDRLLPGLRLFPYNRYNIYYRINVDGIEVYRVLHSGRDIIQIFDDAIDSGPKD